MPRGTREFWDRVARRASELMQSNLTKIQKIQWQKGRDITVNVGELMTRDVKACRGWDPLSDAAQIMWENDCGIVPVVDDEGRVTGMITDRDICMAAHFRGDLLVRVLVEEAMSRKVHTVMEEDTLLEAEQVMQEVQLRRLPVVDEKGCLVGLISLADIAVAAAAAQGRRGKGLTLQAVAKTIGSICEKRPEPAYPPGK